MNLTMVGAYFLDGLAAAAEQFAGRALGAGYRHGFERSLKLVVLWGFGVAAAVSLVLFLAGPALIDLMTASEPVPALGRAYLPYAALGPVSGTRAYGRDGVFSGATWSAEMRNMCLRSAAVFLVGWAALTPLLGIDGLWLALLAFVGVRGLTLLWRARQRIDEA